MLEYDRLTIRIDPAPGGGYDTYAEGSGGDGHGRFVLPFHERDLENFVLRMSRGSRRGRRRMETPETARAREFGRHLFESVFVGEIRDVYRMSLAEARRVERGLRVTLQLAQVPELMDVPWEYLYDEPSFLSISAWTPVVRYLDLSRPRPPLAVKPPLRILGMVSSPSDVEPLDVDEERARLERSLKPLCDDGRVEIDWTEEASLTGLLRRLQRGTFHVFHYIGHGAYDTVADDGVVLLEDRSGRSQQVSGSQLGTILCDHRSLRLAILNACEGARTSSTDPFAGVASSLVQRELPAVIAMQFEITDEAAIVFSEFFYDALALGYSVDNALAHARQGVYASGNEVEWATPVLLLRVADGKLFDVDWQQASMPEPHTSVAVKPPKEPKAPPVLAPPSPKPESEPEPEPEPEPPIHRKKPTPYRRRWTVAFLAIAALAGIIVGAVALGGGSSDRPATQPKTQTVTRTSTAAPVSNADWPAGLSAWTVVVASETDRNAAQAKADRASSGFDGPTGVLRSDDFDSLRAGYWVAFAGQFDTSGQATSARRTMQRLGFADAYPKYVSESG